jgi:hypothetical protein
MMHEHLRQVAFFKAIPHETQPAINRTGNSLLLQLLLLLLLMMMMMMVMMMMMMMMMMMTP